MISEHAEVSKERNQGEKEGAYHTEESSSVPSRTAA